MFNESKRTHVTLLFINLHWLPIAAHIELKALMFALLSFTWIHYFRRICPLEDCVLQGNDALLYHPKVNDALLYIPKWTTHYCTIPKRHKITFTDFYINCSHLVTCRTQSEQLNPYHLQETAKNTSLPSSFVPLTLALSILILLYLFVFYAFIITILTLTL